MADEKLIMVMIAVTDMAKSKTFYVEQLGWSVTREYGSGAYHWVRLALPGGGADLTLSTMHEHLVPGSTTLYFSTSNIEAKHSELKDNGIEVNPIQDNLYGPGSGVKWFDFRDPDGNKWLVAQP